MFCRPTSGSMRSTFHPIFTPVWKSTKDQRLEWRKMPSMAFTSNHLVRFECFRLISTTMGFSVNHIILISFKHICLFRYYINLIELFYVPRSPCVQTLPSCTMVKEGFNIWTSSTEELSPLTHLSTIPMLGTSGFWHIFFLLFLIMIELVNAQYRLCKISKNMFHSCFYPHSPFSAPLIPTSTGSVSASRKSMRNTATMARWAIIKSQISYFRNMAKMALEVIWYSQVCGDECYLHGTGSRGQRNKNQASWNLLPPGSQAIGF